MKRYISIVFFLFVTMAMFAMPAKRRTFTYTQSDGTTLTLMLVGDEHLHYYLNTENNDKMLRGDDGDYYVVSDSELETLETKANTRRQAANAARIKRLNARRVSSNGARRVGTTSSSITGSKKGLVILVNFSDTEMASGHTQTVFNNQFNQEGYSDGGHLGSVHDFFYDQSYGKFDLTFDVVGPVTVSNTMSYYGSNSNGSDKYPAKMVIEACKLADDAGTDFSQYDWDGDGEVDQVYVIYAGYGEAYGASSSTIWPHEWNLTSANYYGDGSGALTLDGVKIDTYACSCELSGTSGSTLNGIGTACHEFSHCLGYPDFYDTSYAGGFGMNGWDLMDAGSYNGPNSCGEVPAGFTSYERMCAGWLTPTELSSAATITGMKSLLDTPEAYIIYNDKNSDEYILLENRQNEKWFKYVGYSYTTPHGLLAIHVDYDETAWNNDEPNNTATHQRMSIIPASGTYGTKTTSSGSTYYTCTESQLKGHPFGGSSSYTSLTGTSNSSSGGKWFTACSTGSTTLNHEVTEITNADDGTISFLFDGGAAVDDGSRYTVTFNAGTGTCGTTSWTQTNFQEKTTLPTATSPNSDWTFIGWSTTEVEEGSTCPTLYYANSSYQPTADITLYAVYKSASSSSSGTGDYVLVTSAPSDWSGQYLIAYPTTTGAYIMDGSLTTLDATSNYQSVTVTNNTISSDNDKYSFTIAASTTSGSYTIKSASGYYIGGSGSSNTIKSSTSTTYDNTLSISSNYVDIVYGTSHLRFNNTSDQVRFRYFKSSSYSSQKSIQIYKKNGTGTDYTYSTNPGSDGLVTPTITFASATQCILMGDTNDTFTATVQNSTGEVSYTSSDESVATVGPKTGRVVAKGVGSTTITATVAAVEGVSKSASSKYTLTVAMPVLSSIAVTTQPTKTSYMEGETFSKDGMVVTATYANGYKQEVDTYTIEPSTSVSLETTDTEITVTYTENGVTVTTTVPITVKAYVIPTLTFAETAEKSMLVGDTYTNIATCSNSTGAITYKSSSTSVVTVDANTGEVNAVGTGSATITATIAAVDKVSKSGTATYNITVTMPALTGIEVKTQPTKAAYNEGEPLDNSGLVLTATYANGYTKDISSGYTTAPADGTVLDTSINNVEVSYTEGDVTKTTLYSITVNEQPKYDVTFVINGKSTTITQDIANTGVTVPTINDITTTIDNEEVTYTFVGWTTTDVTEETATKPTLVTLTDNKYTPTESTTLYAVYTRSDGAYIQGFTLNLTYSETTYYVGAANSSSTRFDSSKDDTEVLTLYYSDGYLWYENTSGKATYVYSSSSSKGDLTHTTTKSNATNTWTMTETGNVVTFCSTTGRYLALNTSSTGIIRCYDLTYPHEWNKTYTDETFATGTTSYYTSHPISDETPTIVTVAKLIDELKSGNSSKTIDDIDKMVDELLGR